jgi:hypothetical protein
MSRKVFNALKLLLLVGMFCCVGLSASVPAGSMRIEANGGSCMGCASNTAALSCPMVCFDTYRNCLGMGPENCISVNSCIDPENFCSLDTLVISTECEVP